MTAHTPREGDPADPAVPVAEPAPDARAHARLLEARLARIERHLGFRPLAPGEVDLVLQVAAAPAPQPAAGAEADEQSLEGEIGEFWLARIGVVALMIGLGFLVAYPFAGLPAAVPSLIGYGAFGGLFWLARRWARSLPAIAPYLAWGSLLLVYFATLRLHFLAAAPVLASPALTVGLLVAVLAAEYAWAVRQRSELTAALVALLTAATAVVSDSVPVALGLLTVQAGVAVWLLGRFGWAGHGLWALVLAVATHLELLVNNPLAGHPFRGRAAPEGNLWFLLVYGATHAAAGFIARERERSAWLRAGRPLLLSGGALLVAWLNVWLYFRGQGPWVELALAVAFLAAALAGWLHHGSRYATAVFANAGYVSLSLFLLRFFPAPDAFGWLAWQGLLVAGTAVIFRSKIIVVANSVIFAALYAYYLVVESASGPVNLSFAVTALLTARLLNWQGARLDLRTEFLRNGYLAAATIAVPYGLYHTVPHGWVSTAWLAAAGGYFGASLWLRNRKYRWMAISTVLATIVYVFAVDLSRLAPAYRILSFLVLGLVLLGISVAYARGRQRRAGGVPAG